MNAFTPPQERECTAERGSALFSVGPHRMVLSKRLAFLLANLRYREWGYWVSCA